MNGDAVPMQCLQWDTRCMPYVVMEDSVPMKDDTVILQSLQCTGRATSSGCRVPAGFAVPPAVYLNVDAVPMWWMQCPTRWIPYVVMEDRVIMTEDAVILQSLQCTGCATSAGCSVPAVVAVPLTFP